MALKVSTHTSHMPVERGYTEPGMSAKPHSFGHLSISYESVLASRDASDTLLFLLGAFARRSLLVFFFCVCVRVPGFPDPNTTEPTR